MTPWPWSAIVFVPLAFGAGVALGRMWLLRQLVDWVRCNPGVHVSWFLKEHRRGTRRKQMGEHFAALRDRVRRRS